MAQEWAASAGPDGVRLGRWVKKTELLWEEAKVGAPQQLTKYQVVKGDPASPGSTVMHLRQLGGDGAEVFLVGDVMLCFAKGGKYLGDFIGSWQGASGAAPAAPAPAPAAAPAAPAAEPAPAPAAAAAPAEPASDVVVPQEPGAVAPAEVVEVKKAPVAAKKRASAGAVPPQNTAGRMKKKGGHLSKNAHSVAQLKTAVLQKDEKLVKQLVNEVDFDEVGHDGKTPVYVAVEIGSVECLKILLDVGADTATGWNGRTPLTVAHQKGNKEILNMLFKAAFQTIVPDGMPLPGQKTGDEDLGIDGVEDDDVKLLENENTIKDVMFGITKDAKASTLEKKEKYKKYEPPKDSAEELSELQESQIKDVMKGMVIDGVVKRTPK
jgi:hypothetical protein